MNADRSIFLIVFIVFCFGIHLSGATRNVPGDYSTITAALSAAHHEDTIFIENGIFEECLIITKNVCLLGRDNRTCGIRVPGNKIGIIFQNGDGTVSNICIIGGGIGIRTLNTVPDINNNLFINNKKIAIQCFIACPYITNNTIINPGISGLYFKSARSRKCRIRNNVIFNSKQFGCYLTNRSEVVFSGNIITAKKTGLHSESDVKIASQGVNCIIAPIPCYGNACFKMDSVVTIPPDFISLVPGKPDYHLKPGSILQTSYPLLGIQNE